MGCRARRFVLVAIDLPDFEHAPQDVQATQLRTLRVRDRIVTGRCARQSGDGCRLSERQFVEATSRSTPRPRPTRRTRAARGRSCSDTESGSHGLVNSCSDAKGQEDLLQLAVEAVVSGVRNMLRAACMVMVPPPWLGCAGNR